MISHLRPRVLQRNARLQPRDSVEHVNTAVTKLVRTKNSGNQEVALRRERKGEVFRQDAGNQEWFTVDARGFADYCRVASKTALPKPIGDQYRLVMPRLLGDALEIAAHLRPDAQRFQESWRHLRARNTLRVACCRS